METFNSISDWVFKYLLAISVQIFVTASIFASNQPKRKYFLWRYVPIAVAYYVLFVIFPGGSWWRSVMTQRITDTLSINHIYTFTYLITIFVIWFCFKINLQGAIFYGTCGYLIQHLISNVGWIVMHAINLAIGGTFELNLRPWIVFVMLVASIIGFCLFLKRGLNKNNPIEVRKVGELVVAFLGILFVAYCRQFFEGLLSGVNGNTEALKLFYNIFASVVCLTFLFLLITVIEKKDIKRESRELELLLAAQNKLRKRSAENIELLNIMAHDLKKQIECLHDVDDGTIKNEVIENIEKAIEEYDEIVDSGCKTLDYVLMEKVHMCRKHNIMFTYIIDGTALDHLKASDIFSLFSNALDNAIECVSEYDNDKRVISLKVVKQARITLISVENYCDKEIEYDNGFPITTKKNKAVHGFGVKSIHYIARKYNGIVNIKTENEMFTLTIVLPA